jgi:glucosyl-dolichyl phosphate glucuronosyltransferase
MKIAVILCTYNRCQSLAIALDSVVASIVPDSDEWEVLVVDNNSKDQTRSVVEDFCRRYPGRFRYRFEPRQGKSNALNTAIREANGSVLAFMDDDVIVDPSWLRNLVAPLQSDQWAGVGGRIRAQQAFNAPPWLPMEGQNSLDGMLALFDLGDAPCKLERPPFGTNMAFPRRIFEKYGNFRTDMGPCPGSEIRNEDTEFGRRLLSAGEQLWYEPSAIVYHAVPEDRLKKDYFLRYWYDHGRALVREKTPRPDLLGIPRYYFVMSKVVGVLLATRLIRWFCTFDPKQRFYFKGRVWSTLGQIVELRRQWRDRQKQERSFQATGLD